MSKVLTDLEWVKLAANRGAQSSWRDRPALRGVHVNGGMAATDAHRLHIAESTGNLVPGLYDAETMEPITNERYPNVEAVTPTAPPNLMVEDLEGMVAITSAAVAATRAKRVSFVTLPCSEREGVPQGSVAVLPSQLLDVLKGATGPQGSTWGVAILTQAPLQPVKVVILGTGRTAVLMPTRRGNNDPDPRFDLSEFVKQVAS